MWKYMIGMMVIFTGYSGLVNASPHIITLTQTACQFLEAEHKDYQFNAKNSDACKTINVKTQKERLFKAKVLTLSVGDYIFRIHNRDVPYDLGFWLRGQGFGRLTLPSVSGGGIHQGERKDYAITLKTGIYHYSCPLNPTLDYTLIVK